MFVWIWSLRHKMFLWYKVLMSVSFWQLLWGRNYKEMLRNWITEKWAKDKARSRNVWWLRGKDGPFAGWMVVSITYYWNHHRFPSEKEIQVLCAWKVDGSAWEQEHDVVSASSITKIHNKAETLDSPLFILKLPIILSICFLNTFLPAAQVLWAENLQVFCQNVTLETTWMVSKILLNLAQGIIHIVLLINTVARFA